MKFLSKSMILAGAISLGMGGLNASTYIVTPGDTVGGIVKYLGFKSIKDAGIESVPSGDMNLIFAGDIIHYTPKKIKAKKRHVLEKQKLDLDKFCFEDSRSIHYKACERCEPNRFESKKTLVRKQAKRATSSH